MGRIKNQLFVIMIFVVSFSCSEPYESNITDYEDILVVQGIITNATGPYKVVLTKTLSIKNETQDTLSPTYDPYSNYEQDAIVTITDNNANVEILNETSPGVYTTDAAFQSVIGNQYKLSIETLDGKMYESEFVSLIQGVELEDVYTEYKEVYDFNQHKNISGIDIKVNTGTWDNTENNIYLKWDYEETWEIEQKWNEIDISGGGFYHPLDTNQYSCWVYDFSFDIVIDDVGNYSSNELNGKTILHIDKDNPKPFYGYSILVKQYTINESVYKFWDMLKESNIETGNVFDNIPFNAESNIECCNGDTKVYGYFDASYISEKRVFYQTPLNGVEFRDFNSACQKYSVSARPPGVPLSKVHVLYHDESETIYTIQEYCVDCSINSTTREKPDYWIF